MKTIDQNMPKNNNPENSLSGRAIKILERAEDAVLVGLLLLMIGMAALQIVLRNVSDSGVFWGEALVRILVLWIGLVGAMVASRRGDHINIDVVTRYLPERAGRAVNFVVELFTAGICVAVAWYAFKFVQMELESVEKAFSKVPVWVCESIIPFAFAVMAARYLVLSFKSLKSFLKPVP